MYKLYEEQKKNVQESIEKTEELKVDGEIGVLNI